MQHVAGALYAVIVYNDYSSSSSAVEVDDVLGRSDSTSISCSSCNSKRYIAFISSLNLVVRSSTTLALKGAMNTLIWNSYTKPFIKLDIFIDLGTSRPSTIVLPSGIGS